MKLINYVIASILLATIVLVNPAASKSRLRRQLFPLASSSASSVSSSGSGAASGSGFSLPWLGQVPSPSGFQLPMNMFPNPDTVRQNADQVRQRAQDYFSGFAKQIQDQTLQNINRLQSMLPLGGGGQGGAAAAVASSGQGILNTQASTNCIPTEKTEIVEVNGRKFNQTTSSCVSNGPGSVATAVASSSVPVESKPITNIADKNQ